MNYFLQEMYAKSKKWNCTLKKQCQQVSSHPWSWKCFQMFSLFICVIPSIIAIIDFFFSLIKSKEGNTSVPNNVGKDREYLKTYKYSWCIHNWSYFIKNTLISLQRIILLMLSSSCITYMERNKFFLSETTCFNN